MIARIATPTVLLLLCSVSAAQNLFDPSLRVQTYASGFAAPTGAVFLNDRGDLLVTEKNSGKVIIVRGRQIAGTALDLPVANDSERGLLSIALSPNFASDNLVYLYHSAAATDGAEPISNKVSRYRLEGNQLVFDRKIIDLLPGPGPNHDGGKIMFDRKGKLFVVIGDLNRRERTQNFESSSTITNSGAILRLNPSGSPVLTNPFVSTAFPTGTIVIGSSAFRPSGSGTVNIIGGTVVKSPRNPLLDIYAYGIRNSFGIAFDPVSGDLWDTENGANSFDEINRVRPGFNSGWRDIQGPTAINPLEPGSLVMLGAQAHYSDPELSWLNPVAPTDLHFYEGPKLGPDYRNDLFMGDVNTGTLYHFELTSQRKSLRLTGPLSDYIVNNEGNLIDESADIRLGEGFGIITDILSGPGGMYVLSLNGRLYRIQQNPDFAPLLRPNPPLPLAGEGWGEGMILIPEPSLSIWMFTPTILLARTRRCGTRAANRGTIGRSAWSSRGCRG